MVNKIIELKKNIKNKLILFGFIILNYFNHQKRNFIMNNKSDTDRTCQEKSHKNEKSYHHDDPAHNNKLREINKGAYPVKLNYAQNIYEEVNNKGKKTNVKNLNLEKEKKNEGGIKTGEEKNLNELIVPDESLTDKSKKDFQKVASEHEIYNWKLNKRMNKLEQEKGIPDNLTDPSKKQIWPEIDDNQEQQSGVISKTKELISVGIEKGKEGIEKAKEILSKF
jgi:hypothetical protein